MRTALTASPSTPGGGGIPLGSPAASGQLPRIGAAAVNPLFGGSLRASGAGGSAGGGMMSGMMSPSYPAQSAPSLGQPNPATSSNNGESAMLQRLMDEINRLKKEVGE